MITALILSAFTATAPAPADDGWMAWYGCWRAQGDPSSTMLCILPADNGVRMVTLNGGKVESESRIVADGLARHVEREGCAGTEAARWSQDQQRIFVTSDMSCGKVARKVSGIMSMVAGNEWLDVQAVTSGTQTVARTTRYVAAFAPGLPAEISSAIEANKLARETARYAVTALLDLGDVAEASKALDEHVVAEWLTATGQRFDLDGKKLIALADAGVPPSVIDVVVAVSNPDRFAVNTREDRYDANRGRRGGTSCYDGYDPWSGPLGYGYGYGGGYSRCRIYDPYYGPWGYGGWGYGGWYTVGTPVVIVKDDHPNARVTRQGYTSGRSGSASSRDKDSSSSPSSTSTNPSRTSTTSSSPSKDSGSSSSGSSSSTTRTAKPRDH